MTGAGVKSIGGFTTAVGVDVGNSVGTEVGIGVRVAFGTAVAVGKRTMNFPVVTVAFDFTLMTASTWEPSGASSGSSLVKSRS